MIDILTPVFADNDTIIIGLTKRMVGSFPPNGISMGETNVFSEEQVLHYRHILCSQLGIADDCLVSARQVHGDVVADIRYKGQSILEADGFITDCKGIALMVKLADCCGVVCYDTQQKVAGIVHSGWRGTQKKIAEKMLIEMKNLYGCKPENIKAWITPCASAEVYEVDWDVARFFPKSRTKKANGKYLFDNRKQIMNQLLHCGLSEYNIEKANDCTITDTRFHSYRRDGVLSGRMGCFILLK